MLYATELLDASVYDADNNYVGRVRDLCLIPSSHTSRVACFVISRGRYQPLVVRYDQIASATPGSLQLNSGELGLATYVPDESWLTIRKDLLDKQIIDTSGAKVVRVNDLNFLELPLAACTELHVAQVDVGLAGAVRRLLKGVASPGWIRNIQKQIPAHSIPWEAVDLIETDPLRRVKLRLPKSRLAELHPADIADILEELAPSEQEAVIESLDDTTAAEALEEVEDSVQTRILEQLDKERIASIIEEMHTDEAVDALAEMSAETAAQVLGDLDREDATELVRLLEYEQDTAGGMMTPEFVAFGPGATVAEVVTDLRARREELDPIDAVQVVTEAGQFKGSVPLEHLLLSDPAAAIETLTADTPTPIQTSATEADVVELFDKYNLRSLPVVDAQQRLMGVITVDDVVSRLWDRQT